MFRSNFVSETTCSSIYSTLNYTVCEKIRLHLSSMPRDVDGTYSRRARHFPGCFTDCRQVRLDDKFDSELEETRCVVDQDGGRHDGHLLAHSAHRAQARRLTPTYRGHFGLRLGPSFDLQGRGKSTSVPLGPVQHI